MNLVRRVARPMLASYFVSGGLDALRRPAEVAKAEEGSASVAARIPVLQDQDPEMLVLVGGAVQVGAGVLLALGRLPRLSALALAATILPRTLGENRFWEAEDPAQRQRQQAQLAGNVSVLGGLLLAAVDTAGKPGVAWRTRHASEHAGAAVRRTRREARVAARTARMAARARGAQLAHQVT